MAEVGGSNPTRAYHQPICPRDPSRIPDRARFFWWLFQGDLEFCDCCRKAPRLAVARLRYSMPSSAVMVVTDSEVAARTRSFAAFFAVKSSKLDSNIRVSTQQCVGANRWLSVRACHTRGCCFAYNLDARVARTVLQEYASARGHRIRFASMTARSAAKRTVKNKTNKLEMDR